MSNLDNTIPAGFRVIPGFPRYAIDENGNVLSVCSRNGRGKDRSWLNATPVKQGTDSDGYRIVCLCHDGNKRTISIHTRVLTTFSGHCPEGMVCRHLDGNKTNNHISNLAWGTHYENSQDMVLHGKSLSGEKHKMVKLTEKDVLEIRARYANGEKQVALAKEFAVTQTNISLIVQRRKWRHI